MLLAVDAGNTHTVLGLFDGDTLRSSWRLPTRTETTEDEFGLRLLDRLRLESLEARELTGAIVSSVVPDLDSTLRQACERYLGRTPTFVGPGIKTGLPILYDDPREVGADRIVNSVAAVERWGAPILVLDFGTATTLDVVNARGEYLGGVIAPGLKLSAEALFRRAARLPRVDLVRPARCIGRNTRESLECGLYHGYAGLVSGIVRRAREELGEEAPVVATGGLAGIFDTEDSGFLAVEPDLTLYGLRSLWEKNPR